MTVAVRGGRGKAVFEYEYIKPRIPVMNVSKKTLINTKSLKASILKDDYWEYVRWAWGLVHAEPMVPNWHMKYICRRLQYRVERVLSGLPCDEDLVINVPPGTSKSTLTSIMLPGFVWAKDPSIKFICGSYAHPLAIELSRKSRMIVKTEEYQQMFPHVVLAADLDTKSAFATTKGGIRWATSKGGSVMGMHAHIILLDDIVDPKMAGSPIELAAANKWVAEEVSSRKVNKAVSLTCLIMQRLGLGDPSDVAFENGNVEKIIFPYCTDYPVVPERMKKKYKRGLLDPKRLPLAVVERLKRKIGEYAVAGQYGQQPVPASGGKFLTNKFRLDSPPKTPFYCRFWDKAGTLDGGNFTTGVLMGRTGGSEPFFVIHDVIRVQLDSYSRDRLILDTARADGESVIIGLEQEGGSGGKQSVEISLRQLHGFVVRVLKPNRWSGKKEIRADPYSVQVNGGNVFLAPGGDWHKDFIDEHKYFPVGRFTDQVDAASGAFSILAPGADYRCGGLTASEEFVHN